MSSEKPELEVRPLDGSHNRAAFSCGVAYFDEYISKYASQNMRRDQVIAWVMSKPGDSEIIGYYTLTNRDIVSGPIPENIAKELKVSPNAKSVSGILLGMFAISDKYHGQGFGTDMCMDALYRVYTVSNISGNKGLILHPYDNKAEKFWKKMDFTYLMKDPEGKDTFFMPTSHIRKIFETKT